MQDRNRRHAVYVIIAVDNNSLAVGDRGDNPLGGFCSTRKLGWVVQIGKFRVKESPGRFRIVA